MTSQHTFQRAVLGACFLDVEGVQKVMAGVSEADFIGGYAEIFKAVCKLWAEKHPVDFVSVSGLCPRIPPAEISTLTDDCPTVSSVDYYIKKLKADTAKRQLTGMFLQLPGYIESDSVEDIIGLVKEKMDTIDLGGVSFLGMEEAAPNLMKLYREGWPEPLKIGWEVFSEFDEGHGAFKLAPGELTIVTGIPGHGKSTFVDAVMVNMIRTYGWNVLFFSPENWPYEIHQRLLLEKFTMKPFDKGMTTRMTEQEVSEYVGIIKNHVQYIHPQQKKLLSHILRARGFNAIVLDPWNHIEERRVDDRGETEYVLRVTMALRQMARETNTHIFLVVHPAKLQRNKDGKYPRVSAYDLHGSAHFRNVADNILAVWRNMEDREAPVEVSVLKVRHRWHGQIGDVRLNFDKITGTYSE